VESFVKKVDVLITEGRNVGDLTDYNTWSCRVAAFLSTALDVQAAEVFNSLGLKNMNFKDGYDLDIKWRSARNIQIGHLEGLALRIEASGLSHASASSNSSEVIKASSSKRVFVVHGHDVAAKESAARFLIKLGLEPIILHEQPNEGRTIIEKFEAFADVSFAIVLLTPDDVGATQAASNELSARARQNVVFELGYFVGKLGRSRVCALFSKSVEIPSDFHGVLYIELDDADAWRTKLAQELVQVGMNINLQGLL
jgi:predicted nucleotide-binding protein